MIICETNNIDDIYLYFFISILLFSRNNSPHPTFRIWHITLVSRDKMHVAVEDTLAGSLTDVNAYIKSIGTIRKRSDISLLLMLWQYLQIVLNPNSI